MGNHRGSSWDLNTFSQMMEEQSISRAQKQNNGREILMEAEMEISFSDEVQETINLIRRLDSFKNICELQGIETQNKDGVRQNYIELRRRIVELLTK